MDGEMHLPSRSMAQRAPSSLNTSGEMRCRFVSSGTTSACAASGQSINTWAYSSFPVWLPAYTLEETIVRLARIGYDGIEIGAASPHAYPRYVPPERRARVKELLDVNSLAVSSML